MKRFCSNFKRFNQNTFFSSSSNTDDLPKLIPRELIAHRGYVMETGVILMEVTGNELLSNDQVRGSYLGIKLKDD